MGDMGGIYLDGGFKKNNLVGGAPYAPLPPLGKPCILQQTCLIPFRDTFTFYISLKHIIEEKFVRFLRYFLIFK